MKKEIKVIVKTMPEKGVGIALEASSISDIYKNGNVFVAYGDIKTAGHIWENPIYVVWPKDIELVES